MRIPGLLLVMLAALVPAPGQAQAYRASVLWVQSDSTVGSSSVPDSITAGAPTTSDSAVTPAFHAPKADNFDPRAGEPPILTPILGGIVIGAAVTAGGILVGNAADPEPNDEFIPTGIALGYLIGGSAGYVAGISVQILATTINEQKTGRKRALARHDREQAAEAAKSP